MTREIDRFFELSPDLLCIASTDGYFKLINPAFKRVLGWDPPELLKKPYVDFVHPEDKEATLREAERLAAGTPTVTFRTRFRRCDGGYRHLLWTAYPDVGTGFIYAVAKDITDLVRAQRKFQLAVESSPVALLMIDASGSIRMANRAAESLFGFAAGELIGEAVERLVPMSLTDTHAVHRERFAGQPSARPMGVGRELAARRKDGSEIPVEVGLNPIEDDDGVQVLCSVVDLTARKEVEQKTRDLAEELARANQRLSELAATDPLTGLRNRRALLEELEIHLQLARRHRRSISLILVDIDHFKEHNDRFGHLAGDDALRRVGEILCGTARSSDFVGRYGGDEFVICLPETDRDGAMLLAERFRAAIAERQWPPPGMTLSLGAATVSFKSGREPTDASATIERLLREADRALYQSKAAGRNRVTHSDSLT